MTTILEFNSNLEDNDNLLNETGYYLLYGFNDTIVYSIKYNGNNSNTNFNIFPTCSNSFSLIGLHKTLNLQDLNPTTTSGPTTKLNDHSIISTEIKNESISKLKLILKDCSNTRSSFYVISYMVINETEELIEKSPLLFHQIQSKQSLDTINILDSKLIKKIENSLITQQLKKQFYLVNVFNRNQVSSKYLSNNLNNIYYYLLQNSNIISCSNIKLLDQKINEFVNNKTSKSTSTNTSNANNLNVSLNFEIYFKVTSTPNTTTPTGIDSINAPMLKLKVQDEDEEDDMVNVSTLVLISKNDSIRQCLELFKVSILNQIMNQFKITNFKALHYLLPFLPFPITTIYKMKDGQVDDLINYEIRQHYHKSIGLPLNRPYLKSNLSIDLVNGNSNNQGQGQQSFSTTTHIKDVHNNISLSLDSKTNGGNVYLVEGSYDYYHYLQDGIDDSGWGCAYRSMQTICSWLKYQQLTNKHVPTHWEIQKTLVDIQDKESSFLKSKQWIGAFEITLCLDQLFGIECKIINITTGADIIYKSRDIVKHFQSNGSPIMIGGGVLAYTMIGIDFNESTGDSRYLILDPHYTGATDNTKLIKDKGWCGWKGPELFKKDAFYNLCCPQIPNDL